MSADGAGPNGTGDGPRDGADGHTFLSFVNFGNFTQIGFNFIYNSSSFPFTTLGSCLSF